MEKIKEFIMNHRVVTIITGVVVVCLVAGGVAFGVHQSNVAKEKAAIEAQKKEEAEKKGAEKKKAEEEAKKAEEEAAEAEAEVEEEVEVVAEATESSNTQSSNTQSSNTQSSSTQSSTAQSQSAPSSNTQTQTQTSSNSQGVPASFYENSTKDVYGNWVPKDSIYAVKTNQYGCVLWSNGDISDTVEFNRALCNEVNSRDLWGTGQVSSQEEFEVISDQIEKEMRGF